MEDYVQEMADSQNEELRLAIIELYDSVEEESFPLIETYMKKHEEAIKKQQKRLEDEEITEKQYKLWMKNELLGTPEWKKLQERVSKLYTEADEKVKDMISEAAEIVYEQSYFRTCYEIEAAVNGY